MRVLILEDCATRIADLVGGFSEKGLSVVALQSVSAAEVYLRSQVVDLVVAAETLNGKLSHVVALLAEYRNPHVGSLLLTHREGPETDELFEMLPSLGCVLATTCPTKMVVQMGLGLTNGTRVKIGRSQDLKRDAAVRRTELEALIATMEYRLSAEDGLGESERGQGVTADWIPEGFTTRRRIEAPQPEPKEVAVPEAPVPEAPVADREAVVAQTAEGDFRQNDSPQTPRDDVAIEKPIGDFVPTSRTIASPDQNEVPAVPEQVPTARNTAPSIDHFAPVPAAAAPVKAAGDQVQAPDMGLQDVFARQRAKLLAERLAKRKNASLLRPIVEDQPSSLAL